MFEFRLVLIRPEDKRLILRFSRLMRGIFFLMAALIAAAMISTANTSIIGGILLVMTLLGGLFEDKWTWDPAQRTLTHRSGLLFLAKNRIFPASEITALELRRFTRGQHAGDSNAAKPPRKSIFATRVIGLALESSERGMVTMETHRARDMDDLALCATLLAEALDIPLREISE